MNISKRSFLKLSMGGTAALFLAPIVRPPSLWATPVILPPNYLDSGVHARWMKLSYNNRLESRETRRVMGAVLRNLGAARGQGRGEAFAPMFDNAVMKAFKQHLETGHKPHTLLGLVQWLYDDFIRPEHGTDAGVILYTNLLSMLRGLAGSESGIVLNKQYQLYRESALAHKNAYRFTKDPNQLLQARMRRAEERRVWTEALRAQAHAFAIGKATLSDTQVLDRNVLAGWKTETAAVRLVAPRLRIRKVADQILVSWDGRARLEQAPTARGPWTPLLHASPASFDASEPRKFFRAVDKDGQRGHIYTSYQLELSATSAPPREAFPKSHSRPHAQAPSGGPDEPSRPRGFQPRNLCNAKPGLLQTQPGRVICLSGTSVNNKNPNCTTQ